MIQKANKQTKKKFQTMNRENFLKLIKFVFQNTTDDIECETSKKFPLQLGIN